MTEGSPNSSMGCWNGEALHGVDAPRTHLVRAWLNDCFDHRVGCALVVMPLYRRFGRRVARFARSNAPLRRVLRPFFDRVVGCARAQYAVYLAAASRTSTSPSA